MSRTSKKQGRRSGQRRDGGFTILEIMIVVAIIGLIMGVLVVPRIMGASDNAKIGMAYNQAVQLQMAYESWSLDVTERCPSSIDELAKYAGGDAEAAAKDPWGSKYEIACGDNTPAAAGPLGIVSRGPDGKIGTDDDVRSWEKPKKK